MITFISKENKIDVLLDNRQKIMDTLNVLEEQGEWMPNGEVVRYVKSQRRNRRISVFNTYEKAQIYSGDLLHICDIDI